jgi:prepilin-type N-terminal cleavage/methylation domain-containing protein
MQEVSLYGRGAKRRYVRSPLGVPSRPSSHMGFSLIELLVVLAIMLIVAAFAVPTTMKVIDGARIRGTMGNVSNLAQRCRMQAIKRNTTQWLHFRTISGRVTLFVTDSTSTATGPAPTDIQLDLPNQFVIAAAPTSNPAPLTATAMWGSSITPNVSVDPYFNSRGLPCLPDITTGACTTTVGYVNYFTYRSGGNTRWVAVGISPAGRVKAWYWYGSQWGD